MAKYYAANIANEVTYDALQVFGGYGYFQEYKVERYYRDARILSIYEGDGGNTEKHHWYRSFPEYWIM